MGLNQGYFDWFLVDRHQFIQRHICHDQLHRKYFQSVRLWFGSTHQLNCHRGNSNSWRLRFNIFGWSRWSQNVANILNGWCIHWTHITWHILVCDARSRCDIEPIQLVAVAQFLHVRLHQLLWHFTIAVYYSHRNSAHQSKISNVFLCKFSLLNLLLTWICFDSVCCRFVEWVKHFVCWRILFSHSFH